MKTIANLVVIALTVLASMAVCTSLYAINIRLRGSWSETIDASDLRAGPGSDLVDNYESALDEIEIDIAQAKNKNWRVDVKKIDANWHSSFLLLMRRTSDGRGKGWIAGGTIYQEVADVDRTFFNGYDDRRDVSIQLKLAGCSVRILADTYSTAVTYTIVEQ